MANKKSFTLIEILISIVLFSIVVLFLYQTLDITKNTNSFYQSKLLDKEKQNNIKKIFFLDFINSYKKTKVLVHSDRNSIISLKTQNRYHNPFYDKITYLVTKERNLLRIESQTEFNKNKIDDMFFDNSYIDVLYKDIDKFKVSQDNKKVSIYILTEKKEKIIFSF